MFREHRSFHTFDPRPLLSIQTDQMRRLDLPILLVVVALVRVSWSHNHHRRHGHTDSDSFVCGTDDPEDLDMVIMNLEHEAWEYNQESTDAGERMLAQRQHMIPVFFNVLAQSETVGTMTDRALQRYIDELNAAYADTNFQFALQGVQRRQGDEWYNCAVEKESIWKSSLHVEGTNALNIYVCKPYKIINPKNEDVYGFSSWPTNANDAIDGVTIVHEYYYGTSSHRPFDAQSSRLSLSSPLSCGN